MVASENLIAEELMQSIYLHQMRAMPAYLSESDATSIDEFMRSELANDYVLDTKNLYWPRQVNRSHIFDLFAEFMPHGEGDKAKLDMINFVSEHKE